MPTDVIALVSIGRHPVSKRPRKADLDARALGLALSCSDVVTAVFAGDTASGLPVLRDYVGAGAASLVALDCPATADPLPVIEAYLQAHPPRLIVAGARAEAGECSGMTPFWLAERLGYGIATNVVAVEIYDGTARVTQALPGGRRRALEAAMPLVVTVDGTAPSPPFSARMRSARGSPNVRSAGPTITDSRAQWSTKPNRPRPKRLAAPAPVGQGGGTVAEGRREMISPDPDAAADAILEFLAREGLLKPD